MPAASRPPQEVAPSPRAASLIHACSRPHAHTPSPLPVPSPRACFCARAAARGAAQVKRAVGHRSTLLTTGEHEYTRYGFRELIKRRAVDILQPDITWCARTPPLASGEKAGNERAR